MSQPLNQLQGSLFAESSPHHWPERWGSTVVTVMIGLTAAAVAFVTPVKVYKSAEEPFTLPLVFVLSPALEVAAEPLLSEETELQEVEEEQPTPAALPEFEENVATFQQQEEQETSTETTELEGVQLALAEPEQSPLEELLAEPQEEASTEPELPVSLQEWKPDNPIKQQHLNELMNRVSAEEQTVQQQRDGIRAQLNRREVETTGREFMFNSDGGTEGMIRMLDVEGFPEDVVKRVYARYGIDVDYRYLRPEDLNTKRTYFNAVITDDESFTTKREEGYYEVFQLSSKAISLLANLEIEAVRERQLDQRNTRVRSITFGIELNDRGEYVLGVIDLQVERLR